MQCSYCFYHDIAEERSSIKPAIMSKEVRDELIAQALKEAATQGNSSEGGVTFAFQGGEPSLAGLKFFTGFVEKVAELKTQYPPYLQVAYAFQTNGLVMDRWWAEFFAKHNFLIGLSIDGTQEIHDQLRKDRSGIPSYKRVLRTAELFDQYKVEYNILTVVTTKLAHNITKVFKDYERLNFRFLQFIPCLDPISESNRDYSVPPKVYGEFLNTLFELWYDRMIHGNGLSIRYFDNLLGIALGYPPESCDMVGRCSVQRVIEADGTVFPCDFYTRDEDSLGNLTEIPLWELGSCKKAAQFVEESLEVPQICRYCQWGNFCRNGCRRHRDAQSGVNSYCSAYQSFFSTHGDKIIRMARRMQQRMHYGISSGSKQEGDS